VRAGLVLLRTAPDDRRRAELCATEAGHAQLQKIRRSARMVVMLTGGPAGVAGALAFAAGAAAALESDLPEQALRSTARAAKVHRVLS
jgi:DNA-binding MarR family transcriptional regulator